MDVLLFSFINGVAHRSWIIDAGIVFFATYALPLLGIGIVIAGVQKKSLLKHAIFSSSLAFGINATIGSLLFRSRPFVDHSVIQLIEKSATSKSFPSDHTALSFALAASIGAAYPRMSGVAYTLACIIGVSRIAAGVHYPLDIITGAFVGLMSFAIVWRVVRL
ncbi:MAG: phosphatase PAP2 family protein [Patescibacteria group bacterium]